MNREMSERAEIHIIIYSNEEPPVDQVLYDTKVYTRVLHRCDVILPSAIPLVRGPLTGLSPAVRPFPPSHTEPKATSTLFFVLGTRFAVVQCLFPNVPARRETLFVGPRLSDFIVL